MFFGRVFRHRSALEVDDDRGQFPEFLFEHAERLLPFEGQRVVFPGRSLARFDPLGLEKPFLLQTAEGGSDRPFREVDLFITGDRLHEGVSVVASPGERSQDGEFQDPFSQLGYFVFHVIT